MHRCRGRVSPAGAHRAPRAVRADTRRPRCGVPQAPRVRPQRIADRVRRTIVRETSAKLPKMTNFFESDASRYEEAVKHSIAFAGAEHELFLAAKARLLLDMAACLGPVSELKVLDVGCGNGKLDLSLQPHVGEVHGTDVADQMIAEARLLNPSGHYQPYDGRVLPYVDKTFDLVFAVCVFHHVEPDARPALISEMARVVRVGGMAAIAEHNPLNPLTRMAVSRCEFDEDAQLLRAREADRLQIGRAHV